MGSRIHIKLTDMLQNPDIKVELTSRKEGSGKESFQENTAIVTCPDGTKLVFDYVCHAGAVTLEKDFNYFRHEEQNRERMRMLFDNGVDFTVVH